MSLLMACEINFLPMGNVDGTIVGNSIVNLGGVDISHRADRYEGKIIEEYIASFQPGKIVMHLDLLESCKVEQIRFEAAIKQP